MTFIDEAFSACVPTFGDDPDPLMADADTVNASLASASVPTGSLVAAPSGVTFDTPDGGSTGGYILQRPTLAATADIPTAPSDPYSLGSAGGVSVPRNSAGSYTPSGTGQLVERVATPVTGQQLADAMATVWPLIVGGTAPPAAIRLLLAQSDFETGTWKYCWNWNFGNAKHIPSDGTDYFVMTAGEGTGANGANTNMVSSMFRSYPTVLEGVKAYLNLLYKSFSSAWQYVMSGDPDSFVQTLKEHGYFRGDLSAYTAGVKARLSKYIGLTPATSSTVSGEFEARCPHCFSRRGYYRRTKRCADCGRRPVRERSKILIGKYYLTDRNLVFGDDAPTDSGTSEVVNDINAVTNKVNAVTNVLLDQFNPLHLLTTSGPALTQPASVPVANPIVQAVTHPLDRIADNYANEPLQNPWVKGGFVVLCIGAVGYGLSKLSKGKPE
jgi:hypothetical protein